ncbi:TPA: excisionase family protein [Escherichia coli]|nr:excisionase family protein [Escherichia coli]HCL7987623.1 excisionase family protein [Escherichia coli]HCL9104818.1 excisionase family protein [Escherichia coli]
MSEVIMIVSPGKWVSEEQLIALKGIKKGTLKKAREKSFMEGREYKHVAHDGIGDPQIKVQRRSHADW